MSDHGAATPARKLPSRTVDDVDWSRPETTSTSIPPALPATGAILDHLPALAAGALVLDIACGTGQPTFALAHARPELTVLGIDLTAARIEQARAIAAANAVPNVRFEVMSADRLELADASVQAAVSQFGLLHEGDIAESVREFARVLETGAPFSIGAHGHMESNTFMSVIAGAYRPHVPAEALPDLPYLTSLAEPGLRAGLLRDAGVAELYEDEFRWTPPVPNFDALWAAATGPIPFGRAFDALGPEDLDAFRAELADAAAPYRIEGGAYVFPIACHLLWGRR